MAPDSPIEAARNRKNAKLFIIVDDTLFSRFKVINPEGQVIILPDALFEEDTFSVTPEEALAQFTPEQMKAYEAWKIEAAEAARREAERPKPPPTPQRIEVEPPKKARPTARKVAKHVPQRGGLAAQWNAPRLTFYKNRIEPLSPKQSFRVTVDGVGSFEMTKEDFTTHFNDVVMSPSYRSDGFFTYSEFPDKVRRWQK